jgi:hypothetical protein
VLHVRAALAQRELEPRGEGSVQPRSTQRWAIVAALAGALVLAAMLGLRFDAVPSLPAEIALGVSLPVLYFALIVTIRPAAASTPRREDGLSELVRLGVSEDAALFLSYDPAFSIDDLKRLLGMGCPLGTALRILWPA